MLKLTLACSALVHDNLLCNNHPVFEIQLHATYSPTHYKLNPNAKALNHLNK